MWSLFVVFVYPILWDCKYSCVNVRDSIYPTNRTESWTFTQLNLQSLFTTMQQRRCVHAWKLGILWSQSLYNTPIPTEPSWSTIYPNHHSLIDDEAAQPNARQTHSNQPKHGGSWLNPYSIWWPRTELIGSTQPADAGIFNSLTATYCTWIP